jgi:hypothetical protein
MEPIRRSAYGFCQGLDGLEMTSEMPMLGDSASENITVDRVPVSQEPSGRAVVRKGFNDLLRGPHGRGVLRDGEVHDPATLVGEQHEHEQHAAGEGRHGEEVHRHQSGHVIGQKRSPGLRRWAMPSPQEP